MTWKAKLETQWNENPLQVIAIAALAAGAAARLIDALSGIGSRRAYARKFGGR